MAVFQQHFWGYEVTYPNEWVHATHGDVEAFAMHREALDTAYHGPRMGYLLVRAEYNPYQRPVEPLWSQHLTKIAVMHTAKKVGSAPFEVGSARGFEAELLLPRRDNRRLWTGILSAGGIILHLMVTHRKDEKETFQPVVSRMVASLRFSAHVEGVHVSPLGMPLPRGSQAAPIEAIYPQAEASSTWEAYRGSGPADALQIFYLREAPFHGWESLAFYPYPNRDPYIQHASLVLHKAGRGAAVHIIPDKNADTAHIAIQYVQEAHASTDK